MLCDLDQVGNPLTHLFQEKQKRVFLLPWEQMLREQTLIVTQTITNPTECYIANPRNFRVQSHSIRNLFLDFRSIRMEVNPAISVKRTSIEIELLLLVYCFWCGYLFSIQATLIRDLMLVYSDPFQGPLAPNFSLG